MRGHGEGIWRPCIKKNSLTGESERVRGHREEIICHAKETEEKESKSEGGRGEGRWRPREDLSVRANRLG